ncbi:MerR family transcriptional regulator [Actinocrinis puniceicyclus]|uniref:MerR family transcriptional regulator n=1 Tax=Actinocrinis puniceicyclus TaxID=977794 RepID=A0A8J8BA59_9ACTN|nr:helix-turn-helix domain-containing protein [Actinocrinis puniceicyclus]MBS2962602.1 MerR family transcriptional regulator [Actinocrinis puniceicyclus]
MNDYDEPDAPADPRDPAHQAWNTTEAAAAAHVDPKTIQTWVTRGKLTPIGEQRGQHLFNGADVLAVEKATRRRPRLAALLAESRALFRHGDAEP